MIGENRNLVIVMALLALLIITGVIGYALLLHVNLIDALYMTVITISTVGYKEVADMDSAAKIFTICIIIAGLGIAGFAVTNLITFLTEGHLKKIWRNRRMENKISELNKHYIVCGAGETGQNIIAQFLVNKVSFVVVDTREDKIKDLHERGILAILGDPSHEATLEQAGIRRAEGLVSALSSDPENIYTVLTARFLNNDLYIVSRAIEMHAHEKLCMAGADRTVSPNEIGGRRMAAMMVRPSIFSFLDIVTYAGDDVLNLEEVVLHEGSSLKNARLKEARIPEQTGLLVLAIKKKATSAMIFNPSSDEQLELGDSMIVLGDSEKVNKLKILAKDQGERMHV